MATQRMIDMEESSQVNTLAAFTFGAVFVVIGLLGFTVSGGHQPVGSHGGHLLGVFQVNLLHNLVHLALGALMIFAAVAGTRPAKVVDVLVGAVYLAVGAVGVFATGTSLNIIALNGADNALHLLLGAVLLAIGLLADR
jgi:hypothetical protein